MPEITLGKHHYAAPALFIPVPSRYFHFPSLLSSCRHRAARPKEKKQPQNNNNKAQRTERRINKMALYVVARERDCIGHVQEQIGKEPKVMKANKPPVGYLKDKIFLAVVLSFDILQQSWFEGRPLFGKQADAAAIAAGGSSRSSRNPGRNWISDIFLFPLSLGVCRARVFVDLFSLCVPKTRSLFFLLLFSLARHFVTCLAKKGEEKKRQAKKQLLAAELDEKSQLSLIAKIFKDIKNGRN